MTNFDLADRKEVYSDAAGLIADVLNDFVEQGFIRSGFKEGDKFSSVVSEAMSKFQEFQTLVSKLFDYNE